MKVLFAVSSESISDAIIKRYQKEHKEILSYKNVYYFNAILKEIQKDKSYDRIVISEDLEPFSNSNYDTIDKFIFEKLDNISDEANDGQGKETSIILICTDRHTKGSSFLVKLFGIGIYNALLGNDRSMEQVCRLINQPRLKKEAKMYYKIDADDVSYDPKSEKEVSELEIQNILNHFKKIAKNKEKFADSFDNIASQYTDDQLKIIINCLPINVKAVLEEECPKYQELMSVNGMIQRVGGQANLQTKEAQEKTGIKIDILESKLSQPKMSGPIVIPSSVRTASSKGPIKVRQVERPTETTVEEPVKKVIKKVGKPSSSVQEEVKKDENLELDNFDSMLSDLEDDKDTNLVEDSNLVSEKPEVKAEPKTLSSVFEEEDDLGDDSLLMSLDVEDSKEDESLLMSLDDGLDEGNSVSMVLDDEDDFDTGLEDDLDMDLEAGDDLLLDFDDEEEPVEDIENNEADELVLDDLDLETEESEEKSGLSVSDFMEEDTDSFELDSEDDLELDFSDDELELVDEDIEEDIIDVEDSSEDDDLLISLDDEEIIEEDEIEEVSDEDLGIILDEEEPVAENKTITIKRGRGRPRKTPIDATPKPKGKRGRPRKNPLPEEDLVEEEDDALELVFEDDADDNLLEESSSSITPDMFLNQEEDVLEEDDALDILSDEDLEEYEEIEVEDDEELDTLDILDVEDEDATDEDDDSLLVSLDEEEIDDDADLLLEFEDDEEVEEIEDLDDDDLLLLSSDEDIEIVDDEEYTDEVEIPALDDLDDLEDVLEEDDDSLLMSEDSDDLDLELDTEEFSDEVDIPDLDGLDDLEDYEEVEETVEVADDHEDMIPGLDYEEFEEDDYLVSDHHNNSNDEDDDLFLNLDDDITETKKPAASVNDFSSNLDEEPILNQSYNTYKQPETNAVESIKPQVDYSMSALNSLMTKDKKIVTFIGTTKNGTSFLINNLAILLSSLGINTAVLDMTQNRNSYYIYTKNEEELRKIAYTSIDKLENGYAEGIRVDKNLTVYTALPNNGKKYTNAEPILSTLIQNHSLVLIDCDFETDPSYFASCQEIYLVQSMDILTIQPLTSFLRDLKAKGVLESEKVRVVINKEIKVRSLTSKTIIGGMSFYNDPAMSFMTELFNKDMVKYCTIPFEDATYSKYLDSMVNCSVSLNGYSNAFKNKLRILGDMVYPLTSVKQSYSNPSQGGPKKSAFSSSMNNTLNQMKNKF